MKKPTTQPPQTQSHQPGTESEMNPQPKSLDTQYVGSGKLQDKVAIITGGDSGIGKAVAIRFAQEGADCVIVYLNETEDATTTKKEIEAEGRSCLLIPGDIGDSAFCQQIVDQTISKFGHLDIVINNAGEQHPQDSIADITDQQLERTFKTNVFAQFYLIRAALPHLKSGSVIINTTSVTAYRGSKSLLDYSATKGAVVSLTRSLALSLADKNIRVNAVAPGPIWTPLIPSTFPAERVEKFGSNVPLKRAGQPVELASAYVFLASDENSYMTGQVLHPNGGEVVNA